MLLRGTIRRRRFNRCRLNRKARHNSRQRESLNLMLARRRWRDDRELRHAGGTTIERPLPSEPQISFATRLRYSKWRENVDLHPLAGIAGLSIVPTTSLDRDADNGT
ncbi:hypothetical protein [Bradyrhizobium sp. NP1]|uniref:hypothetical protein n=1 Tax=Bradyrhizobium sp. NP1 TaxID=3049772 RepID=UPI0025A676AE|nr:hypothetical protein [Bradyrhizobium sp. NP1]WJR76472.1 hypothetical protein QOU61_27465 [Bradyrhizobium sp. NP1]